MISKTMVISTVIAMSVSVNSLAAPKPSDPKKQTPWYLYVDSTEAYDLKMKLGDKALFVDVREPVEIMFTGFTDVVDVIISAGTGDGLKGRLSRKGIQEVLSEGKNPDEVVKYYLFRNNS